MSATDKNAGDERLRKPAAEASRGSRDSADAERTEQMGLSMTSAERQKMIADEWVNEVLPKPPEIPGFHTCWLSTTNSTDPIYRRIRMGYTPVKIGEVPGMELYKVQAGDYADGVQCNEMILFKIPLEIYQDIMTVFHHNKPREAEQSIKERILAGQQYDSDGNELVKVEEGIKSLGKNVAAPYFT